MTRIAGADIGLPLTKLPFIPVSAVAGKGQACGSDRSIGRGLVVAGQQTVSGLIKECLAQAAGGLKATAVQTAGIANAGAKSLSELQATATFAAVRVLTAILDCTGATLEARRQQVTASGIVLAQICLASINGQAAVSAKAQGTAADVACGCLQAEAAIAVVGAGRASAVINARLAAAAGESSRTSARVPCHLRVSVTLVDDALGSGLQQRFVLRVDFGSAGNDAADVTAGLVIG